MSETSSKTLTHPAEIEREIQRQIAAASAARTKASLFNLVIFRRAFSRDPSAEALSYLLGRRPARIILIESGTDGPAEAFVSARCHPEPKNLELCFQEIRIQEGSGGVGRDPGFWSPLLIRDIPAFVWWLDGTERLPGILGRIAPFVDRFLGDSGFAEERGEEPLDAILALAARVRPSGVPCADFSWHRIFPLRLGTARLFDPPEAREALNAIREVRLRGGRRAEGLLFFFWLAARLGWTPRGLEQGRMVMSDARGNEIEMLHESPAAPEEGLGLRIELAGRMRLGLEWQTEESGSTEGPASTGTSGCGLLTGPGGRREHLGLRVPSGGEVLLREVDSHTMDSVFADVLSLLAAVSSRGE